MNNQLDYALIGNCQFSAILDSAARIVWCCLDRFDSPAVFAALIGEDDNGTWSCLPEAKEYKTSQSYIRNTNVVVTRFDIVNGDCYEIVDFAPRFPLNIGYYRMPQIIRILRRISGSPKVRMHLDPKFNYGKEKPNVSVISSGAVFSHEEKNIFLHTDIPITYILSSQPFELNGDHYCVLSYGRPFESSLKFGCEEFLDRTVNYWRSWVKHCRIPFEHQEAVLRSALVLKLHIFEDTGAIIAATTTSIPESPDGNRTWDYRLCWLRDAYFVIHALNQLGQFEEMEKYIQFLYNIASDESEEALQPVYGIGGEKEITEQIVPWLKGWKGYGPVRIGNEAYRQVQYDAFGEMVLAVAPLFFDSRLDHVDQVRAFRHVKYLVEQSIRFYDEPDAGLWEFRGSKRHYLFSKLMSWAAVDRGIKIAKRLNKSELIARWETARARFAQNIESEGWNGERGFYTQTLNGAVPDSSNLLMLELNYLKAEDPKFVSMVEGYQRELMHHGVMFRYRDQDDFGFPVNAFTVCSFWMVDALHAIGKKEDAAALFKKLLTYRNHVGLLSEHIDSENGQLWGNFPQTYSHVGIINSAFRISKTWGEGL